MNLKGKSFINFGEASLCTKIAKEFEIVNTSKVTFEYNIRLDSSSDISKYMKDFIKISPSKGNLKGGESIKIKVYIVPTFPMDFE